MPNQPMPSMPPAMPSMPSEQSMPPMSPGAGMEPPMSSSPEGAGMAADEMVADLSRMFEQVENKEKAINTRHITFKNSFELFKKELFRKIFEFMKSLGVDPSDLESINKFLEKLRKESPDLAEIFEIAFNDIEGGDMESSQPPQAIEEGAGLMEGFNNLAPEMMMPRE